MIKLGINILHQQLEEVLPFCIEHNLGIEVDDFAVPYYLDNNKPEIISIYKKKLNNVPGITSHGPFQGLYTSCIDEKILNVCRDRHYDAIESSAEIGASIYVIHLNFQPLINNPHYVESFIDRNIEFWSPILDFAKKKQITIAVENMWEPTPELQINFIEKAKHPNLKSSFDNGHTLVFSKLKSSSWAKQLAPYLIHCHLHDNFGKMDEHNEIGNGIENWSELLNEIDKINDINIVLEAGSFEQQKQSYKKFSELL